MSSLDSTDADTDGDDGPKLGGCAVSATCGIAPRRSLQETYLRSLPGSPMPHSISSGDLRRSRKALLFARYGLDRDFGTILEGIPSKDIVIIAPKEFETRTDKMCNADDFRDVIYIEGYLHSSNIDAIMPTLRENLNSLISFSLVKMM